MTDTTPDYAGLSRHLGALAYHIQQTGTADGQDAQTCLEVAEALRALLESNAALERERTNLIETKREQIGRLNTRIAELEKALEPFAREAEEWSPEDFDDSESIAGETNLTVGHLRAARAYRDKGRG